jgi:sensor histidine kinase YesM
MKRKGKIVLIVSLGLVLVLASFIVYIHFVQSISSNQDLYLSRIEYMEDAQGTLRYQDVSGNEGNEEDRAEHPAWQTASRLMKGFGTSAWWVRIRTEDLQLVSSDSARFLTVINPTVEKAALYIPAIPAPSDAGESYRVYYAGWGYPADQQNSERFAYPVFKLPDQIEGDYIYLQLSSSYSNNYTFRVMDQETFDRARDNMTGIVAFLVGLIAAFGFNILFQFQSFGSRAKFFYILYLVTVIIYQVAVLGMIRVHFPRGFAEWMVANSPALALLMFAGALLFYSLLLDLKRVFPLLHKLSRISLILICLNAIAIFAGFKYWGNIAAMLVSYLAGILIIVFAYFAVRKNIEFAAYLLAGCLFIFVFATIFNLRSWGIIPSNELSLFVIMIPLVVQTVLLAFGLREFIMKLAAEKKDAVKLYQIAEREAVSREAAFLQAQIRPHFLFNALNVIAALCYTNPARAGEVIGDLATFFQYSFGFRNLQKYVSFKEEMEFIKAYVRIEQARFGDGLKVNYELEDTENLMLPPLLLQPLIENAIKHGIRKRRTSGTVTIRVKRQEEHYRIEVENDGEGMTAEEIERALSSDRKSSGGVGLENIRRRLRMFYQTDLTLESVVGAWTKVTILLPVRESSSG